MPMFWFVTTLHVAIVALDYIWLKQSKYLQCINQGQFIGMLTGEQNL